MFLASVILNNKFCQKKQKYYLFSSRVSYHNAVKGWMCWFFTKRDIFACAMYALPKSCYSKFLVDRKWFEMIHQSYITTDYAITQNKLCVLWVVCVNDLNKKYLNCSFLERWYLEVVIRDTYNKNQTFAFYFLCE